MSIITLTTDFGTKDHFVGAVKGAIYNELEEAKVIDISHQITPFSITQTAYVLKNAYKNFPKGTIHIIGVDSEISVENKPIAILLDGQYFIGCDNGILSLITNEIRPEKIVEITIPDPEEYQFAILGKFIKVACHIARGGMLEVIGMQINSIKEIVEIQPFINSEKTRSWEVSSTSTILEM
jgi:S-adenosylmethionine hydrolase